MIKPPHPSAGRRVAHKKSSRSSGRRRAILPVRSARAPSGLGASMVFKHGRRIKVSAKFVKKAREAVASENYFNLKSVGAYLCNSSQCQYWGSPTLYSYLEVHQMAVNINASAAVDYTMKYLVKSATLTCQVVNSTNAQAYLRVYECTPRNDIPATGVLPMTLLSNGFLDSQGTSDGLTDIDQTAFGSSAFCQGYRMSHVRLVKFNPGEQKVFTITDLSPQLINMARWNNQGTQMIYGIRNKSRFFLFQCWGQVATDSANTAHVGTTIETFRVLYTMKYAYQFISDYTTNVFQGTCTDAAGNSAVMTTLTTPSIIEEMTGAVAAVVQD